MVLKISNFYIVQEVQSSNLEIQIGLFLTQKLLDNQFLQFLQVDCPWHEIMFWPKKLCLAASIFRQRNIIHLARVPARHEIAILVPDLDVGTAPLERPAVAVSHLTFLEFFHLFLLSPWLSRRGKPAYCPAGKSGPDVPPALPSDKVFYS